MKYENPFDEIVKQYYKSIQTYCSARLGNEYDADDCTQEVFIIFCQKADKLNINDNIRAWLYRTADNVMKSFKRKNSRYISFDEIPEIPVEDEIAEDMPFNDIISKEEYEILKEYYLDKEKIGYIAKKHDISETAASKRISRIKIKIVKRIDEINNKV